MAHIETSRSGRRNRNVDLNLVPFIDLMSVLITFLLITAVWTQVSMIQIGTSFYGKKTENVPPTVLPKQEVVLKIEVKPSGYILTHGRQTISLPLKSGEFDDVGLVDQLQRIKQLDPEKEDAIIAISDGMPYERLIRSMDNVLQGGFPAISIATGGP